MAGDWIKMRGNLWDDPRVGRLCDLCETSEAAVIGALYWLWATADQHTEDGCMPGLSLRQIDRKTGVPGFADALVTVGWLIDDPQGVVIVKFEEHNGASAKRRCADAQRKANSRTVSASDADNTRTDDGQKSDEFGQGAELEKEKRREEANTSTSNEVDRARRTDDPQLALVGGGKPKLFSPPDCPQLEVLALWAQVLPSMPQHTPSQWRGARADHLRARWRESAVEKAWPDQTAGLAYLSKLFAYVGQSQFLTGRASTRDGKRPFVVELEWLVKPINWAKVIEGKYHTEAA